MPASAAPQAPGQGSPGKAAGASPSPTGVLRSNVGEVVEAQTPRRSRNLLVPIVAVAAVVVLGIAAIFLFGFVAPSRPAARPQAAALPQPTQLAGRPASAPAAAPLPAINDISCDALEATIFHIHVHLAIFINGNEQLVPFGVGIGQPWQVQSSDEGPFVTDGACFYWIHTHTEDGVIHIESPIRRTFTLGDFFAIWQQPLSATQVGPVQGQVITYVNGMRDETNPPDIRLLAHQRIQIDVGSDVPPQTFDFPPGD